MQFNTVLYSSPYYELQIRFKDKSQIYNTLHVIGTIETFEDYSCNLNTLCMRALLAEWLSGSVIKASQCCVCVLQTVFQRARIAASPPSWSK